MTSKTKTVADNDGPPRTKAEIAADEKAIAKAKATKETEEKEAAAEAKRVQAAYEAEAVRKAEEDIELAKLPVHGPEVEGQGKKARYITCLGYPLHHPYQDKLVGQDVENAVTLRMDFWTKTQLDAKLIAVAPEVD